MLRIFSLILTSTLLFSANAFASYRSDLKKVSRSESLYDAQVWDANVLWTSVLFTDEFRTSFAEQSIKKEHLEPTEAATAFADQMKKQAAATEFTLFLYTKKDYKKLTAGDDTFWKLRLQLPSGEWIRPSTIELLPMTPYIRVMFPDVNRWAKAYRVTFPKQELKGEFTLHLQSVIGESSMKWNLK